jgi:amidase
MIRLSKQTATYTFGPDHPPAVRIRPGDTVVFETDGLEDLVQPAAEIDFDHVNAATGPVYIEDARPGDTLVAEILEIRPLDWGAAMIIPGFGFLSDTIPGPYTHLFPLGSEGPVPFGDRVRVPLQPMIGTIGVAPLTPVRTLTSGAHGGNLDIKDVKPGNRLYLPVLVEGALFGVGDVHAAMGDGEVCGTGIECGAEVTIRLNLRKDWPIERPRIESPTEIMTVAAAQGLEEALRLALQDMVAWLQQERGLSAEEAYVLVSIAGDTRIGQVVDPAVTVRVALAKALFVG